MKNTLFYGDNLTVLREEIARESVDLIYLDPPFNSKANYNIIHKSPAGQGSDAQIEAFKDSWTWENEAEIAFDEVMRSGHIGLADLLRTMRAFLKDNDLMAYLAMMAVRLIELHRVLKPTGSLYLHCDPTASHYLKMLLDGVFGAENFVNEIVWKRYGAHNDVGQGSKHFGRTHDIILLYSKSDERTWNQLFIPLSNDYTKAAYRYVDSDGRRYRLSPLTGPGGADKGNPVFEWNGHTRAWRINQPRMQEMHDAGLLAYSKTGYVSKKLFLDQSKGAPVQDNWNDIAGLSGSMVERLGYQTQKPLALLERIIAASSNPGDIVLDPFCGCGTAVDAAQKLGRQWIGIDITHLAIALIERRMKDRYGADLAYEVIGTPKDLASAEDLARRDKYQFQWWAVSRVDAMPVDGRKKGADGGVDGVIYFKSSTTKTEKAIVSVKGGDNVGVGMIRDLHSAMEREKAPIGVFVTKAMPTSAMLKEAAAVGRYDMGLEQTWPRVQIITLAELFQGKKPAIPAVFTDAGFRKAAREPRYKNEALL